MSGVGIGQRAADSVVTTKENSDENRLRAALDE